MEKNDVQLIRRILSGDDAAFTALVRKHQKGVHALAWRKVGDFHIAEEITQDTFLQAYKKLSTLKNPNQFAGWLYVIASNLCKRSLQKKKLPMQSLESTSVAEIENSSYKRYVSEHPTPPSVGKPLVPWAATATVAVLVMVGFGVGNQNLAHFQRPYNFQVEAESTVEIVDASIVLDSDAKLTKRNLIEQLIIPSKNTRKNISVDTETPNTDKSEERFFGLALAEETSSEDGAEDALDLKALFAAIKHHDSLLKSGAGEVIYTDEQPPVEADTRIIKGRIAFDSENTRFDSQGDFNILTPTAMWQIAPHRRRHPKYHFSPEPRSLIHHGVDPRRWLIKDLAAHLESENFQITGREVFNNILCYVLEAKHGDTSEKIWIAPGQGFRYLKRESRFPRPVDALDSDIPMEALTIIRTTISYQEFGEIWFPKVVFKEYAWLDFKATYPIISRETLELKNFKVNHDLPPETFIVDLPEDALIKVEGISKALTKQEFLKRYGQHIDK